MFEMLLVALLVAAVGYIIYLEQRPKTDAERERRAMERDRLQALIDAKNERDAQR